LATPNNPGHDEFATGNEIPRKVVHRYVIEACIVRHTVVVKGPLYSLHVNHAAVIEKSKDLRAQL
jgi:hypothetical protein